MEHHITVLIDEAVDALNIQKTGTYVDATLGAGGHTREILSRLDGGTFVGIDLDSASLEALNQLDSTKSKIELRVGNFRTLGLILEELGIEKVDGILADLGWRMEQFSGNGRGFSFNVDEELLMTLGDPNRYPFVARDILNDWKEDDITNVLKAYGEERFARNIARGIVSARDEHAITTTFELVDIINASVPAGYRRGKIHPATKTFQALRIAVNDELEALEEFIRESIAVLNPHGRLAIITFHSLEDRIVKHTFKAYQRDGVATVLTKKPITPTKEEKKENARSRSAKLRILEKNEEI